MQIDKKHLICGGLISLMLSGCATSKPAIEGSLNARFGTAFGTAVQANIQAHAVAPTAQQKANTYIPADPSRAALARKNYRENTVANPEPINASGGR